MTNVIEFKVPFVFGEQRPRILRNGRSYLPKETRDAQMQVIDAWQTASLGTSVPPHVPVKVFVTTIRPLPASRPKSMVEEDDTYKPDADNLAKLVLDALTKAGAWDDDAQVTTLIVNKAQRARGLEPRTYVRIEW